MFSKLAPANRRSPSLLLAACAIACLSTLAFGQVRQVEIGGGMDANPQIGSGGTNRPVQGYVPINGNDIMTGNVAGLKYFHGQVGRPGGGNGVGTFSPYEFSGRLGSASIEGFARTTAGAMPGTPGYSGALSQSFFLPSSTVSTSSGTIYSAPYGSGFDSALVPGTVVSPLLSGSQIGSLNAASLSEAARAGQMGAFNRALPPAPRGIGEPGALLDSSLFAPRLAEQSSQTAEESRLVNPLLPTRSANPRENTPSASQPAGGDVSAAINSAVPDQINDQQTGRVNNQLQGSLVDARVSVTFKKLEDQLKLAQGPQGNTKNASEAQPGTIAGLDFDPLTGKFRQNGNNPSSTQPGAARGGTSASARGGSAASVSPRSLENLSDNQLTAGGKVKPVNLGGDTPASTGAGATTYDVMMNRGQTALKAGKYLDAAAAYQAALASKPQDPLALVGRAHGELGAGMYASAAYDLKFVFSRNPELISVKYDVGSFIPASRQQFLLDDLKKMAQKPETSDLGSFLYAYLCYQTGRTIELQMVMQQWGDRQGHDMWQGLLSRAWKPVELKSETK